MRELADGATLESQGGTTRCSSWEEGQPLLHVILSIITAGLWLIVCLLLVIKNKRQRIVLFVSEEGVVETRVTQVGIAG